MTGCCIRACVLTIGVAGLAASAGAEVTGSIEYRFVTVAGTAAMPNTTGLMNGVVLGPNTVIDPFGIPIRQRIALQMRAVGIGGTFVGLGFNGTNTGLEPGVTYPALNLGLLSVAGSISMGEGAVSGNEFVGPYQTQAGGMVSGSTWSGFSATLPSLGAQAWPAASVNPPGAVNPAGTGAGGGWVTVASYFWQTNGSEGRTITGGFAPTAGGTRALVGNTVTSATFPDAGSMADGSVTYAYEGASVGVSGQDFGFLIIDIIDCDPDVLSSPQVITADPFVNPDALNLVLASFSDCNEDNLVVQITSDGGIGALGGVTSVVGNGGLNPMITLTWDAPNAAIGRTFVVDFTYTDGLSIVFTGQTSVTVVPAPGSLMMLAVWALAVARRHRVALRFVRSSH